MGATRGRSIKHHSGFTMIEVIAVLVIIGIIAAFAVVRVGDTRSVDLHSQVEVIKSHLRYAQSRAMASSADWGVNFTSGTTYYLFEGTPPGTPVSFLGEDSTTVNLAAKKSAMVVSSAPLIVTFDEYGSPGEETLTLTVSAYGESRTITVTKNTGFIP